MESPPAELSGLAEAMRRRKDDGPPYVLFLGAGCATAAGLPVEAVSKAMIRMIEQGTSKLSFLKTALGEKLAKAIGVLQTSPEDALGELTSPLDRRTQQQILRVLFARIPVPLFYQSIATLVKSGYFREILTTNFDDLLEQALAGERMQAGQDFRVINIAANEGDPADSPAGLAPVTIVKLRGDLSQNRIALTPDEVERALMRNRPFVKQELRADMVMVNYDGESPAVEEFLQRGRGEELWWVHESKEPPDVMNCRELRVIMGEGANPKNFFGLLYHLLMRRMTSAEAPNTEGAGQPEDEFSWLYGTSQQQVKPEENRAAFLEGEIRRALRQIYELEQRLVPGEEDPALVDQLDYQCRAVAERQDELRSLDENKARILGALDSLVNSVRATDQVSLSTAEFLIEQVQTIRHQFEKNQPDHVVTGAALCGALAVCQRLPRSIADRSVLRELGAFVPGYNAARS